MNKKTKRFSKINIEISNICNLQCSFCPEVIRDKKMMSVDLFEKIIQQVSPLTDQVCLHLMGDPLVHPQLSQFIEICARFKTPVFFVTNGVLLREDKIETLLHPIIRQINFSLHSFNDNFPDRDPTMYLDKIFHYTEAAFLRRPDLYINYRLWNLSEPRGRDEKNTSILGRIENYYNVTIDKNIDVKSEKSIKIKNRLYLHYDTEFTWPALNLPVLDTRGTCLGLKSHFGILADGTVVPCCLDKEAAIPLGDLNHQDILTILKSPRAVALRQGFQDRILVEDLCQRCNYIERFN
ncbi:MAG: radical SAM protein [Moraxellaceae bacterium]|nr:radical SAM protein [Pseudobdellovibrionaceae bacterium]